MERRKIRQQMKQPVVSGKFRVGDRVEVCHGHCGKVVSWEQWAQHHKEFGLDTWAVGAALFAVPVMRNGPIDSESCQHWALSVVRKICE